MELAEVLTEQYLSYALMTEEMPELEVSWVLERLRACFTPEDLELLIDDDFGRGLLLGQLVTVYIYESLQEAGDDEAQE